MSDEACISPMLGLKVYPDEQAEQLKTEMDIHQHDVQRTVDYLEDISFLLLKHVKAQLDSVAHQIDVAPIYVMRGGIIMRQPCRRIFTNNPSGLIVLYRSHYDHETKPKAIYGNIPEFNKGGIYLLLDLIINSGSSMIESLKIMKQYVPDISSCNRINIVTVYSTQLGIRAILSQFPEVEIHTLWSEMEIGKDKRLIGVNFDAGDYAFGSGSIKRIHWGE